MTPNGRYAITLVVTAILFTAVGTATGYWLAGRHESIAQRAAKSAGPAPTSRKVLYWYDPMVPNQHFDKPGKSPFMDMQLVAKYADEGGDAAGVKIDPSVEQNLGVRLAKVASGVLTTQVNAEGNVQWNDRQVAIVQARSAGFVERTYSRAAGDIVAKNAPLADLLMPEWAGAQREYLALRAAGDATMLHAARARLRLLGIPEPLITQLDTTGQPQSIITIRAPIAGVIQSLDVRTGMTLAEGATLAKISSVDPVWVEASIPESQAGEIKTGMPAHIRLAAYPGKSLTGKVSTVLPDFNADSRTLRVRVELPNADGRLKAGMYAHITLDSPVSSSVLLIPSEAVIRSGKRNIVMLALAQGRYQPVEVKLGREANGKVAVLDGLTEGQSIVVSGQFLIDSEASLKGLLARQPEPAVAASNAQPTSAAPLNEADGKIEFIQGSDITLSHGPVKSLGWGPMTMPFQLARQNMASGLKPGDRVHFGFRQTDTGYVIEQLHKIGDAP